LNLTLALKQRRRCSSCGANLESATIKDDGVEKQIYICPECQKVLTMSDNNPPIPRPSDDFADKTEFFCQLLPADATEKEVKFFRKMVSRLRMKGIYEETYMDFFAQRWPRRLFDDLWTLKTIEQSLEGNYKKENAKYIDNDWMHEMECDDALWRMEFLKSETQLKGLKTAEGTPPRPIARAIAILDRAIEREPMVEHQRNEHKREKLRVAREKLASQYKVK